MHFKFSACFKTLTELHALGYASMKLSLKSKTNRGLHGRDRMVVGFTTSCAISAFHYLPVSLSSNPAHGEVYSIQHYVISLSVTCGRLVVFSVFSYFLHPKNWMPDIGKLLLKVVLSTLTLIPKTTIMCWF